ncbi:MAG: TRAP transporter substrate-binding protein, partial [Sphaerochaetaceae bacterium]
NFLICLVLCLATMSFVFAAGDKEGTAVANKTYSMKFGHDQMEDTPHHMAAMKFKELVEQRTNGNVQVSIFPAQQLGSAREEIEGLQIGTVEAVSLPSAAFSGFDLATGLADLPFLFPSPTVAYKVLDGPAGDKILQRLGKIGITGAAYWTSGFKQFTGSFPINTPADFKGRKIRVMSNPVLIAQYEAMGASAIPIDFHELYNALQQKAVDGQENPLSTIVNMKFYEVQRNITISNHGMLGYIVAFNSNWLSTLPAEYQKIVLDAAKEVAPYERDLIAKLETERYLPTIKDFGCQVVELTQTQRKEFQEMTRPAYDVFAEKLDSDGKALLKELQNAVAAEIQ